MLGVYGFESLYFFSLEKWKWKFRSLTLQDIPGHQFVSSKLTIFIYCYVENELFIYLIMNLNYLLRKQKWSNTENIKYFFLYKCRICNNKLKILVIDRYVIKKKNYKNTNDGILFKKNTL